MARAVTTTVTVGVNDSTTAVPTPAANSTEVAPTEEPSSTITLTSDVVVSPIESTPTSVSSSAPQPAAPAFSCPEDNNTTVSQLFGNERFDYQVLCDTDVLDANFWTGIEYSTFSECVAACSSANYQFNDVVCAAAAYYGNAGSCFLKASANRTVSALGVNTAILQRIAVGISEGEPLGTATESSFGGVTSTMDPADMSSTMSSIISNSTTTIPIITPGPENPTSGLLVNGPSTSYITYISNGETYSSGTVFSTYVSANGTWYSSYYHTYT